MKGMFDPQRGRDPQVEKHCIRGEVSGRTLSSPSVLLFGDGVLP